MKRSGSFGALVLGVSVVFLETSLAATRYVALSGGHVPPFTNWATAATNIQALVDEGTNSGLIGHWTFDGNNADDFSGNGNDGVIFGATPTNGVFGGAYHFDGNNRIEVGNLSFATQEYTVNGWIRTTEQAVSECWRMWIAKMNPPSGDATFELLIGDGRRVGGGPNGPGYLVWQTPGVGLVSLPETSDLNLRDGSWHMMTATYSNGSQRLYVNGALVAESQYSGSLPLVSSAVAIGGIEGFGPYHHPWIGDIDEVSIYSRTLSSNEVWQLYEQNSIDDTVLYFSIQETAGDEYDLYTIRSDPTRPNRQSVPMNDPSGDQKHPVVSPDGRFVLYTIGTAAYPDFELWVLDRSTGERQFLFNGHPEDWHPSGQRFVYISNEFCSEAIQEAFVSETSTGLVVTSTRVLFDSSTPAGSSGVQYSPDGRSIVFTYCPNYCSYENLEIYVASLEGSLPVSGANLLRLTANNACDFEPHWTPDGRQIIWGRSNGENLELWRKNADGSGLEESAGSWSNAGGAYLAFCTPPAGYMGPYMTAFYHGVLKKIILLRNNGEQDTLDIGQNDVVDGLEWVSASYTNLPPDTVPPSVPQHLHATATSDTSISLAWDASTDNIWVCGYRVYRDRVVVGTNATPSYTDAGLAPDVIYRYAVSAFDFASNESPLSASIQVMTTPTAAGDIRYVSLNGGHVYPYTSWADAATNIQTAIDVALDGDIILVTNGVYATGGRVVHGAMMNRVAIIKSVTVRSVNGPAVTVIQGAGPVGDSAVRCAYVGINAVLSGFTLTNGATRSGGNWDRERCGGGAWCETLGTLSNCLLTGNSADSHGGGSWGGKLYNCVLLGNSAYCGGGASYGTLNNCTLTGNSAYGGGGAFDGTLYNCVLSDNSAADNGGGASHGTLNNCTLTGNSAYGGGGAYGGTLNNCIVYYNDAGIGPNFSGSTFNYSCTTPDPGGSGNITNEPMLASVSHLAMGSPCIGVGHSDYATGTDIDGELWRTPSSMGCDEVVSGSITGALSASARASYTNATVRFPIRFAANIRGRATGNTWDFGDGTIVSNKLYAFHAFSSNGVYAVLLRAFNESDPLGIAATVMVQVSARTIHYVNIGNATPTAPYTSWVTAATNIQDAIDAVTMADALVLVTNGVYATGGRVVNGGLTNRVVITKPIRVQSANGPDSTLIVGQGPTGKTAVRCAYLANGAQLCGFTLTNGYTIGAPSVYDRDGGGIFCESLAVLSNCVISGNSAFSSGGGAYGGILNNCTLSGNSAGVNGGGSDNSTLYNCTLSGNSASYGGGTYGGILNNCIVYYNTASNGTNFYAGTLNYCCTAPDPGGTNNITSEPQFVDATNGDYRLLPSSPCIDRGINQDWMVGATDLAGNPRILNSTVDMGAYEFYFQGNFKVWLQGPYITNTHKMTTALNATGIIPLTSPYADDPRQVTAIPSNATDWVLLQLRKSTNSIPFVSKSVFLDQEGYLLSDNGAAELMLEASTGSYYMVIKHRNHLAVMSANPVPFTNRFVSYDFTTNANRYYGKTNDAIRLESNRWGMIAGDADGDGEILNVDALIYDTQTNSTGYKRADFNLDGVVSNNDRDVFWTNNIGRCTAIVQGETILKPALKIQPSRKTLLAESTNTFFASSGTGTLTWAFVKNPSGGTNFPAPPTSIVYRAGTAFSCIDVLEAWDREDRLGRAYVNVIGADDVARAGKAVIVAGRRNASDSLWPTTDYLADLAFNTLVYRGYSKTNIQYLNPVTNQDVDGNGQTDDIDLETSWAHAASTFTNWVTRTDRLFVYLVDHGGDSSGSGYFRLNDSEILTATNLDAWLDNLQNTYTTKVTILIDCCYAGSFLDELAYTGAAQRIVIAACGTNEPTYFLTGGLVSFSDAFFGGVMRGDTVEQAWLAASNAMSDYQNACWDDDGGAAGLQLGASFVAGKDIPQIGSVMGDQLLTRTTAATLWAGDVVSVYPIERVWCLVVPPGHQPNPENPVADIPELDLTYDSSSGRYKARYDGFSEEGSYKVLFYAEDIWSSVSAPRQSYVQQSSYDERVILVGGGTTNWDSWSRVNSLSRSAYRTFQSRWLNNENICYLSAVTNQDVNEDGTNAVDALISLANIANAITDWAGSTNWGGPADALTVYLIGEGTNQTLRLNETEFLDANSLNGWLNTFQMSNEQAKVNVVMDFSGSGWFLAGLAASNRICMASCRSDQPAIWAAEGLVSFSRYFLSGLFEGDTLYQAFSCAERAIRRATGPIHQEAQLDDNGDGASTKQDGLLACQRYIGAAFMTGADVPAIGSVTPDTVLINTTSLWLWAQVVTDMDEVSNVWCIITPPDYTDDSDLVITNLTWDDGHNCYEALYAAFNTLGTYVLTFQAMDKNGEISTPMQAEVVSSDEYEPDNTSVEANAFVLNETQTHNFHSSNDEDWVKFYAIPNYLYEVEAIQQGTNVDVVLDVYYEQADGALTNIYHRDNTSVGSGNREDADSSLLDHPAPGMYYVRVSPENSNAWGISSEYELKIKIPEGGELVVFSVDRLNPNLSPPDARAIVDGIHTQLFVNRTNCVSFSLTGSIHTVKVEAAAGYRMQEDSKSPNQITNPCMPYFGNPQIVSGLFAGFLFYPYVYVSTNSIVRDPWTQERLSNVVIAFKATCGIMSNVVYNGYPNGTNCTYKSYWYSQADGTFPTNVWLPAVNYDLTVTKANYSNGVFTNMIFNPTPGQTTDLWTLWLTPLDFNANGIADSWEERYFGANRPPMTNDADGDGHNNYEEYRLGTDPTSWDSVLKLHIASQRTDRVTFTWPVANGRTYEILTSDQITSGLWTQKVFGPHEAEYDQTWMQGAVTNPAVQTRGFYRLNVPVP